MCPLYPLSAICVCSAEWLAQRLVNQTDGTYGRLRLVNSTTAEFDQVCIKDGSVLDTFSIIQTSHGEFSTSVLPPNITKEIEEEMESRGEKPGETQAQTRGC